MKATLDAPGTVCALAAHDCSRLIASAGGFDQHHPIPVELGGDPNQPLLALCPIHHRRQHALIRYLIESGRPEGPWNARILRRFTVSERSLAVAAVQHWTAAGAPTIHGWPCPAAKG